MKFRILLALLAILLISNLEAVSGPLSPGALINSPIIRNQRGVAVPNGTSGSPITSIVWSSSQGSSGTATLTFNGPNGNQGAADWQADMPLLSGANTFTIVATDAAGETMSDTLTYNVGPITYSD